MKPNRKSLTGIFILVMAILVFLSGCSPKQSQSPVQQGKPDIAQDGKTVYPLTLVDDTGTSVTIPAKPERIVSLLPSSTEILAALGQEPIAVTQWDDYPQDITKRAEFVFQDALNPNLEQLLSLQPDLIMFWLTTPEATAKIRSLGIPVVVFDDKNIAEIYETIALAGQIIDRQEEANLVIAQMKAKEKGIEEKLAQLPVAEKRKVWLEVDSNLFTAGQGTFLDEIITKAGGINIAQDIQGWGQFNSEQVIARDPDVIIETYSYADPNAIEKIRNRQGWANVQAVKNNRVIGLENNIISRQGPRIIDGLELTAKAIYPELFPEK